MTVGLWVGFARRNTVGFVRHKTNTTRCVGFLFVSLSLYIASLGSPLQCRHTVCLYSPAWSLLPARADFYTRLSLAKEKRVSSWRLPRVVDQNHARETSYPSETILVLILVNGKYNIKKENPVSCKIVNFVATHRYKLHEILRSRALRVLCDLFEDVSPRWGEQSLTAVEFSECTNIWLWICMRSDIYWLDVILFRALWGGGNK